MIEIGVPVCEWRSTYRIRNKGSFLSSGVCWKLWMVAEILRSVTHARRPGGHSTRGMSDLHGLGAATIIRDDAL